MPAGMRRARRSLRKMTFDGKGTCSALFPVHSEPRMMAGAPLTNDIVKCQLKPINYAEYKVTFTRRAEGADGEDFLVRRVRFQQAWCGASAAQRDLSTVLERISMAVTDATP